MAVTKPKPPKEKGHFCFPHTRGDGPLSDADEDESSHIMEGETPQQPNGRKAIPSAYR